MRALRRPPRDRLAKASNAMFYGYVAALLGAGGLGSLFAKTDAKLCEGWLPLEELPPKTAATVLSQHRFLRAMELGFGLFAFHERERIHTDPAINRLFLSAMGTAIGVRGLGLIHDGKPAALPFLSAGYEGISLVLLFANTRRTV
jgi:hypothetical protein